MRFDNFDTIIYMRKTIVGVLLLLVAVIISIFLIRINDSTNSDSIYSVVDKEQSGNKNVFVDVKVENSRGCGKSICHELLVSCENIEDWPVEVRETEVENPRAAVVLGTGGPGTTFYFNDNRRKGTRSVLMEESLESFEFRWRRNWISAGEITNDMSKQYCVYAETVKWIQEELAEIPQTMCAQGNSGGSFQISYGLTRYGLEDVYDMVILTGGPSSRLDVGCFGVGGPEYEKMAFPANLSSRQSIDVGMGYEDERYCQLGSAPASIIDKYEEASVVNKFADFSYPNTKVNFVNSEGDKTDLRLLYYDAIETEKAFYTIPGDVHELDRTVEGALKVQELLVSECK